MSAEFKPELFTPNCEEIHEQGETLYGGVVIGIKEIWTHQGGKKSYEHIVCASRDPGNCWRCIHKIKCPISLNYHPEPKREIFS